MDKCFLRNQSKQCQSHAVEDSKVQEVCLLQLLLLTHLEETVPSTWSATFEVNFLLVIHSYYGK